MIEVVVSRSVFQKILKERILDNNLYLWEGKKNMGNSKCVGKYKILCNFSLLLFSLKNTSLFKAINILLYHLVYNIYSLNIYMVVIS